MQHSATWTEPVLCHYNYNMAKSWFVHFTFTDHLLGQTVRKQYRNGINFCKRKEDRIRQAHALLKYLKDKLQDGWNPLIKEQELPNDLPETVRDAIEKILKIKKSSLKTKSNRNYEDITNMFLTWCAKRRYDQLPLKLLKHDIAQSYMDYLLSERNYSGKSHNGHLGILKAVFNAMKARWKIIMPENPFDGIATMPETTGKNIAYTEEEARALMLWLKKNDIRVYYAASIMFHCYIRKTELCELQVRNINWQTGTITIGGDSSKNRIQDSVTIPEGLWPILEEMNLRNLPGHFYIFGHLMETSSKKISKPDIISNRHKVAIDRIKQSRKGTEAFSTEHDTAFALIRALSSDKTFYSWKHTGVVMYWHVIKDVYYMMRQLRHHDMKVTMVYLKSLGLMPNEAFKNARVEL